MTKATTFRLDLLCSKDELRPVMNYVKVTKDWCEATDAHIGARVRTSIVLGDDFIERIPEEGILIHREDWKRITQANHIVWKSKDVIRLIFNKKRDVLIEVEYESEVGKYVNLEAVIPQGEQVEVKQIGVNPKLLDTLGKALGVEWALKLMFFGQNQAIKVCPISAENESDYQAVIMPVRLDM